MDSASLFDRLKSLPNLEAMLAQIPKFLTCHRQSVGMKLVPGVRPESWGEGWEGRQTPQHPVSKIRTKIQNRRPAPEVVPLIQALPPLAYT